MLFPLVATKLYIPRARPKALLRRRLTEKLSEGLHRKLSLISASAGYGKTTLVSEWLSACDRPAAWLSLDEGDNELHRFLAYVIAALHTIAENQARNALELLQSPQPPPIESILAVLINDIASIPGPFILVLDDYHVIHHTSVHTALMYLLEHLPPNMHLVVVTREEPGLPLARMRVRDEVTELGAMDLRFTESETAAFLTGVMNVKLTAEAAAALENRTEGWIAALQIAAVTLQGRPPAEPLPQSFAGNQRVMLDYLVEEVLHKQPEATRTFLLYTSVLDRLCGPLCEAVLPGDASVSGDEVLLSLYRANLFIVPLDDENRWFRYHHLFAELLRHKLQHRLSSSAGLESVTVLHDRASVWYENNAMPLEAFRHAVAAGHVDRAARLAEGEGMPLHLRGAASPVLSWLETLPKAELDARPSLWIIYGSALLITGRPTEIEPKLQAAEAAMAMQGLDTNAKPNDLLGIMAATRAAVAAIALAGQPFAAEPHPLQAAEDALQTTVAEDKTDDLVGHITPRHAAPVLEPSQADTVIAQSRRSLEYLNPELLPVRVAVLWMMGVAYQLRGDRKEAMEAYSEVLSVSRRIDSSLIGIMAAVSQGSLLEKDNRLYEAEERYRSALKRTGEVPLPAACEAYMGLARIRYEWNDLENAMQYAQKCEHLARQIHSNDALVTCGLFFARVKLAEEDAEQASGILADVKQFIREHRLLNRLPDIAAVQVQTAIRRGDMEGAAHLARMNGLPLCAARAHLARGDTAAALAVLEPIRSLAEARGWRDERLKATILQAVVLQAQGAKSQASLLLLEALELAEPGGVIRSFVDEGPSIVPLLAEAAAYGRVSDYVGKLLAACEAEQTGGGSQSAAMTPIETLTPRELEVLQLIADGLSNRQIGERLYLALDTVKGHNRRIFEKLQVQRRTEAIALARKLGWIR
ncbi:LuxR C-terminal-related transcriptional regulator [Paenibacillus chartarius]|uniref:LuxR C-terminal-related transcriptional regulator n=1 Tax=Paenibacillus chartarius TaxID=747481 RepID=A0ABV6DG56_9BACL